MKSQSEEKDMFTPLWTYKQEQNTIEPNNNYELVWWHYDNLTHTYTNSNDIIYDFCHIS